MRKLIVISAFVLASVVTADAGQNRGLVLATADAPAQAQSAVAPAQAEAQPAPSQVQAPTPQRSRPVQNSGVRHRESDEAKARRIAARYGVYW